MLNTAHFFFFFFFFAGNMWAAVMHLRHMCHSENEQQPRPGCGAHHWRVPVSVWRHFFPKSSWGWVLVPVPGQWKSLYLVLLGFPWAIRQSPVSHPPPIGTFILWCGGAINYHRPHAVMDSCRLISCHIQFGLCSESRARESLCLTALSQMHVRLWKRGVWIWCWFWAPSWLKQDLRVIFSPLSLLWFWK